MYTGDKISLGIILRSVNCVSRRIAFVVPLSIKTLSDVGSIIIPWTGVIWSLAVSLKYEEQSWLGFTIFDELSFCRTSSKLSNDNWATLHVSVVVFIGNDMFVTGLSIILKMGVSDVMSRINVTSSFDEPRTVQTAY